MFPSAQFERKWLLLFLVNLWILQHYTRIISASKLQESDEVRIAQSLHKKEVEFVDQRREIIFQSLKKLEIHCSKNAVPNIALLGSGGGERAMVGLLGSLVQLDKAGLLDSMLYLSGVSGSTWCMASLYKEPDWSTKLETVKDKIIERLSYSKVSWKDANKKLKKYHSEKKDLFTLTDFWAVMVVTTFVKEIDEHTLSDQWDPLSKDPFPIYTVVDKQCKQCKDEKDSWFEISPYEAGYSLTGAFVNTSSFGSQFDNGSKKKQPEIDMPEMDMLYLQALCGSALGDEAENYKFLWGKMIVFMNIVKNQSEMSEEMRQVPNSPPVEKCYQVLRDLADMNLHVLNGEDPSALDQSIRTTLNEVSGNKSQLIFPTEKLNLADKEAAKRYMKQYTEDVCNNLILGFSDWPDVNMWTNIYNRMSMEIWGRNYDFLYNMTDETVPLALLESKTRDYIDAGLILNSPYFSMLRKERNTDLIISLDFSEGDPFLTVTKTAEICKRLNISFPDVPNFPEEEKKKPKDFYVFKGQNAPTVIHIPLFNVVNCGDDIEKWIKEYRTIQPFSYSKEMIIKLMDVAGKNISNNKEKLKEQIKAVTEKKRHG